MFLPDQFWSLDVVADLARFLFFPPYFAVAQSVETVEHDLSVQLLTWFDLLQDRTFS